MPVVLPHTRLQFTTARFTTRLVYTALPSCLLPARVPRCIYIRLLLPTRGSRAVTFTALRTVAAALDSPTGSRSGYLVTHHRTVTAPRSRFTHAVTATFWIWFTLHLFGSGCAVATRRSRCCGCSRLRYTPLIYSSAVCWFCTIHTTLPGSFTHALFAVTVWILYGYILRFTLRFTGSCPAFSLRGSRLVTRYYVRLRLHGYVALRLRYHALRCGYARSFCHRVHTTFTVTGYPVAVATFRSRLRVPTRLRVTF